MGLVKENELLVAHINSFGCNQRNFWLVEQEPVRVLALEKIEVNIEESMEGLELFFVDN